MYGGDRIAETRSESRAGIAFGVAAYAWWGFVAAYFKLVASVAPLEILAHRIIWSVAVLAVIVAALRRWPDLRRVLHDRRALLLLVVSTLLIAANWFIFIWAVTSNHLVEASLGYFMNPLVNVILGALFLGERLRSLEKLSVAIAAAGVLWLTFGAGVFPWVSLVLASTFGLYGLVRKIAGVTSIEGLTIETVLLLPPAIAYLAWRAAAGTLAFTNGSPGLDLLLVAAGPITALPLLWFASAVRRLRLATVGLLQYISPTIQFTLAIAVFHEPFDSRRLAAFVLIWCAVAIYSTSNLRHAMSPARAAAVETPEM